MKLHIAGEFKRSAPGHYAATLNMDNVEIFK